MLVGRKQEALEIRVTIFKKRSPVFNYNAPIYFATARYIVFCQQCLSFIFVAKNNLLFAKYDCRITTPKARCRFQKIFRL